MPARSRAAERRPTRSPATNPPTVSVDSPKSGNTACHNRYCGRTEWRRVWATRVKLPLNPPPPGLRAVVSPTGRQLNVVHRSSSTCRSVALINFQFWIWVLLDYYGFQGVEVNIDFFMFTHKCWDILPTGRKFSKKKKKIGDV